MSLNGANGVSYPATAAAVAASTARKQTGVLGAAPSSSAMAATTTSGGATASRMDTVYRSLGVQSTTSLGNAGPQSQQRMRGLDPRATNSVSAMGTFMMQGTHLAKGETKQLNGKGKANGNGIVALDPVIRSQSTNSSSSRVQAVAAASSNAAKFQQKPVLKAMPIPLILESRTNVRVTGNLEALAESVTSLLRKHEVDVVFNPDKCKWIGVAYCRNRELSVRVFLYSPPNQTPNVFVLEFQRRQGCAAHFSELYDEIYHDLLKTGFVISDSTSEPKEDISTTTTTATRKPRVFAPPPIPSGFDDGESKVSFDMFVPVIEQTKSEFLESQRQGLREIANLASEEANRKILASSTNLLQTLVQNLGSSDGVIRRCSCSALEAFSKDKEVQPELVKLGLLPGIRQILSIAAPSGPSLRGSMVGIDHRETRRLAAKVAANMANRYSDLLTKDGGLALFSSIAGNEEEDPKVRDCARLVLL